MVSPSAYVLDECEPICVRLPAFYNLAVMPHSSAMLPVRSKLNNLKFSPKTSTNTYCPVSLSLLLFLSLTLSLTFSVLRSLSLSLSYLVPMQHSGGTKVPCPQGARVRGPVKREGGSAGGRAGERGWEKESGRE